MTKLFIIIAIIFLLCVLGYLYLFKHEYWRGSNPNVIPAVTKSIPMPTNALMYCLPENLAAIVSFNPGAGNVYGTFTLKNISQQKCKVLANAFISVLYDTNTVKNIAVVHVGHVSGTPFYLLPNQLLYSQIHYPNGPQCTSIGINKVSVMYSYQISPTNRVSFKNSAGKIEQTMQTCTSPTNMTQVEIWQMSSQPITPK